VMPFQVSEQSVARNSWTLAQAAGLGGAGGAGSAAAETTPAIALMTTRARTECFTVFLLPKLAATAAINIRYIPSYIAKLRT
jgi:hypothetical protein